MSTTEAAATYRGDASTLSGVVGRGQINVLGQHDDGASVRLLPGDLRRPLRDAHGAGNVDDLFLDAAAVAQVKLALQRPAEW